MKKIIAIALILCLLLAIAACKRDGEEEAVDGGDAVVETYDGDPADSETKADGNKTLETLEGGMKVKEPQGGYGETQLPDAE